MPFVLKKNPGSYEWPVTVESPSSGGKFRKDTFKALFKKLSRSEFASLAEQGEDALVTEILDGWKDVKDEEGEEGEEGREREKSMPVSVISLSAPLSRGRFLHFNFNF